jgi:hypothetical protein
MPSRQWLPDEQTRSAARPAHAVRPSCPISFRPQLYTARERAPMASAWYRPEAIESAPSAASAPATGPGVDASRLRRPLPSEDRPSWPLSGMEMLWPPRTYHASPPPRESLKPQVSTCPSPARASELRLAATRRARVPGMSCAGPEPPLRPRQPRARSPPPQLNMQRREASVIPPRERRPVDTPNPNSTEEES